MNQILIFGESPPQVGFLENLCFVGPHRTRYRSRYVALLYFVQSQVWTHYFGTTLTLSRPVDANSNLAGLCDAMTSLENNISLSVDLSISNTQTQQDLAAAL